MVQVRIRQRIKSSMQSGRAQEGRWILEYEPGEAKRADPLTGWAGSGDTREQVRIAFESFDAARSYAEKHSLSYQVSANAPERSLKLQVYADNFKGPDIF